MYNQGFKFKEIFVEIFLIAIALSMDSAALSVANGAKCLNLGFAKAFKISFVYAFFQAIMPVFGFLLGISFVKFISEIDHFVAFGILAFLGVKMIKEALHYKGECSVNLSTKELILGAIATSIDALAVGVTFAFSEVNILYACFVIGLVCLLVCLLAVFIGKKTGEIFERKALILGGLILIFLGFKILCEHLGIF